MPLDSYIQTAMADDIAAAMLDSTDLLEYGHDRILGTASPVQRTDDFSDEGGIVWDGYEFVAPRTSFKRLPPARAQVKLNGEVVWVADAVLDDVAATLTLRRGQ